MSREIFFFMIQYILQIVQVALGVLLILVILLQQRGTGLGAAFGGGGGVTTTMRGVDKIFHHATIILAILFFGIGLLQVII